MERGSFVREAEEAGRELREGTYINPLRDFSFKRIFGEEQNKELLIDFLNELLKSRGKQIVELYYSKNEYVPRVGEGRSSVCDLTCTGKNDEQFIIEVQRARQEYFMDRTLFYVSNMISTLGQPGSKWQYKLPEVYFIGLMDFSFENSDSAGYVREVELAMKNSGKTFYDKLS